MPAQLDFAAQLTLEARRMAAALDMGRVLEHEAINRFLHLEHRAAIDGDVVAPGDDVTAAVESAVDLLSEFPVVAAALAVGALTASRARLRRALVKREAARHQATPGVVESGPLAEVAARAVAAATDVAVLTAEHARNLSVGVSDLGILERLTNRFPIAADSAAKGPETGIEIQYLAALAHRGKGEAMMARIEALPSNAHQAEVLSGLASLVGAGQGREPGVRELVLERADLLDWSEVPEALDFHVLSLLSDQLDRARALLQRWRSHRRPKGMPTGRVVDGTYGCRACWRGLWVTPPWRCVSPASTTSRRGRVASRTPPPTWFSVSSAGTPASAGRGGPSA